MHKFQHFYFGTFLHFYCTIYNNTFEITWKYKDEREEILNFIEGAKNDE